MPNKDLPEFVPDADLSAVTPDDALRMIREMGRIITFHTEEAAISEFKASRAEFDETRKYHLDQVSNHEQRGRDARIIATVLYHRYYRDLRSRL